MTRLLTCTILLLPAWATAQTIVAVPDTVCVVKGQSINFNVVDNDIFDPGSPGFVSVFWVEPYPCIGLESNGALFFINDTIDCCGDTLHYSYRHENCQGPVSICEGKVTIIVKCPKPDCYFVDMEQFGSPDPDNVRCAKACENAPTTFYFPFNPVAGYVWSVAGGSFVTGANPATIDITWGPAGPGSVTLVETIGAVSTTYTACVDILSSPVAGFTAPASACLNAPVSFTNTSVGGVSWNWDFGDGSTSSMYNATHSFSTPGLHTVCLTVSKNNVDEQGNPLCCCTDEICMDILIDSLEGPKIYCPSTLCANDSSKYWTDADCATLTWTVKDHLGVDVPFTGQGTNMISVQWGAGPSGTVTLEASGCSGLVCEGPVTATIPIISTSVIIGGETVVCSGEVAVYTVPKWLSVYYDWEVTGAVSWTGEGTNSISVQWGSSGTGTISLQYFSDFLSGLPGQDPADCSGSAALTVEIRPKFQLLPNIGRVCVGDMSSLFATSFPSGNYDWTISGSPAPSFTGDGSNMITITWDAGPGTFVVTATPIDPTVYCNEIATMYVQVIEVPEPKIEGPLEVCPGSSHLYFADTDQSSVGFIWSATNGTISGTGNPVTVTWDLTPAGPYTLSLQQYTIPIPGMPSCTSGVKTITVTEKMLQPFVIDGEQEVCINSVISYDALLPQPFADATYLWQISNPLLGSIVSGQGTPSIDIQWNNLATSGESLSVTVELCGQTHTETIPITVVAPTPPTIMQNGVFCPGVPFILTASGVPGTYFWSTSETTASITSATAGTYSVILTEPNGCISTTTFTATAHDNPPMPPDGIFSLCTAPCTPSDVTVTVPAGFTYAWDCFNLTNGTSTPPGVTGNSFTHMNTCLVETYLYRTTLTNANGCTSVVENEVEQTDNCTDNCLPEMYDFMLTATNRHPDCNIVDFTAVYNNVLLEGWNFGDTHAGGALDNIFHEYELAGTYIVTASGLVDNQNAPPPFCVVAASITVHIPMVADFSCVSVCNTVNFTDETSFNLPTDSPTIWQWSFGDAAGGTSTMQNPTYAYSQPGTYTVTLVVENADGCRDMFEKTITVSGIVSPVIAPVPAEICEGESLTFSVTVNGGPAVQWDWLFSDDGATNGAEMPQHAFLVAGTHTVFVTVTDAAGCFAATNSAVTVHPLPADQTIMANPGLSVCAKTMVMLSVPLMPGYTYIWSDAAGSTTSEIMVTDAGTYSVTITDENGCTTIPDPVTLVVMPVPNVEIAGSNFLCDDGCNPLSVPFGPNFTYNWAPNGETTNAILACSPGIYAVTVTDMNTPLMCRAESSAFEVFSASEPVFSINISPNACAGMPVTLEVDPIDPDLTYTWNTGESGPSIVVSQAGSYYAIGTNNITGCSGSAVAVIHPLPDLCLVPAGCYEACDPDTICGPEGYDYQWNKDGLPIPGANGQCLIVEESGTYSLTATNDFGCTMTSDTLMLKLIDCTCFGLSASATPAAGDSCCWNLSYNNPPDNIFGVQIYSDDADLFFDLSTLNASLTLDLLGVNLIGLSNIVPNTPLPGGALNDFLRVCLSNVQNSPQEIIFDWYGINQQLICSDTVVINALLTLVDTLSLCPGETVTLGGVAYTAPDVVDVILPGANGACDTAATYHLLLSPTHTLTLTCPPDITVGVPAATPSVVVDYTDPVATSTCAGSVPTIMLTDGLPSGDDFPLGETLVCYKASDPENCCSNEDDCCFKVTVVEEEDPCDEQTVGCIKYELLDIVKDAAGNQTYRMRVTNNCPNSLIYVAFQVPDGILAMSPPNGSIYTAPSGREYDVRNPNFSPVYSIRFKSTEDSIRNGESDIFEYVLPPQVCQGCIYATARLYPKIFYSAHLCCIMPMDMGGNEGTHTHHEAAERVQLPSPAFLIYPNPTDGALFADLSAWEEEMLELRILNSQGGQLHRQQVQASAFANEIALPEGLPSGLYILEIIPASGERQKARFILQR